MDDLKIIKKKYGEKMMHLCRELFPIILETPGVLSDIMLKHFEPSRFLYDDIVKSNKEEDFKNYIYSFIDVEKENKIIVDKTPEELLSEAGYILYECKTEEEIQEFKKYYAKGEELCTFNGGRLSRCHVFFAVKKNVNEIRRENFTNPEREDEYGTSVISIQFTKSLPNTLSIKNRYNHRVNNPDNTFNNNLDNIIPGLTESFKVTYGYEFKADDKNFELPGYVNVNGKYYKYNYEINNIYYCPNNIIIDNFNVIDKYSKEPERYIVLDYFIIDLKRTEDKKLNPIELYDVKVEDSFVDEFKNIEFINVSLDKNTGNRTLEIIYDGGKKAIIVVNNLNQMIEYHNNNLTEMPFRTLSEISELEILDTPNLIKIGDRCLRYPKKLTNFIATKLTEIGNDSLVQVDKLIDFIAPNLTKIGHWGFWGANMLERFEAPNLRETGTYFLFSAPRLTRFSAPNLIKTGKNSFIKLNNLIEFIAPNLIELPNSGLKDAEKLTIINISCLEKMGRECLKNPKELTSFIAPNLTEIGDECLMFAYSLKEFKAPKLTKIGDDVLKHSNGIVRYVDANKEYVREIEPQPITNEENVQEEPITKVEKTEIKLVDKIHQIIQNGECKIKEFKKKMIEKLNGGKSR